MSTSGSQLERATSDVGGRVGPRNLPRWANMDTLEASAIATLSSCVAFALTLALTPLRGRSSFLMMVGAVAVAAVFGGRRAGIFSALLGSILFAAVLPSLRVFSVTNSDDLLRMVLFLIVSGLVSMLAGRLRRLQRETARLAEEAQDHARKEREARLVAEAAIAVRDDFISVAAHELRAPLAAMQLTSDSMRLQAARASLESFRVPLERLDLSLQRLTRLIGNVLDSSQLSVGRLPLHPEEFELGDLASEVARRLAVSAERAGCPLNVRTEPARGRWDRDRMDQVITNLLSNAVKFGAGRPIELSTRSDDKDAYLTVRDAGVGIAPEDQARIFERFERASSSRRYPGLGLGLWISRAIVEQHGGDLALESTPGSGSAFTVRLPL